MQSSELDIPDVTKEETEPDRKESIQNIIPFWSDNPNILLSNDFMFELFPVEAMSFEQKLNAISRTVILLSLVTFFYTKSVRILFIAAISLFFIFMLHKSKQSDPVKKEAFFDKEDTPAKKLFSTSDEMHVFREPDSSNPLGNVLVTDYIYDPNRKPAPPAYNERVNANIIEKAKDMVRKANPDQPDITDKLFKDLGDEYVFEQSLRPFNSTASTTIPNDQESFSEFCYGSMVSCKEGNAFACAKNVARYNNY